TKTIVSEPRPTGNKNEFSITYAITVEDTTGYRAYYDLSDTIQLGHGADFVSASVTYDDGAGTNVLQTSILDDAPTDTAFLIVDDEMVEEFQKDVYLVEVIYSIDPNEITEESADCDYTNDDGNNSGLTNIAVIFDAIPLDRDTACAEIPVPGVRLTKSVISEPVSAGSKNEFMVVYAIAVEDTTGVRAYYSLSDTLKYGGGIDFVSAEVTYGGSGLNTSVLDANPSDTAFGIVEDEWIEDFGVDSFYVAV